MLCPPGIACRTGGIARKVGGSMMRGRRIGQPCCATLEAHCSEAYLAQCGWGQECLTPLHWVSVVDVDQDLPCGCTVEVGPCGRGVPPEFMLGQSPAPAAAVACKDRRSFTLVTEQGRDQGPVAVDCLECGEVVVARDAEVYVRVVGV